MMRVIVLVLFFGATAQLKGGVIKTEVIEETEKKEVRVFCSKKSEQDAKQECDQWLKQQKETLGDRVLTSFCGTAEISTVQSSSCLYKSMGEIKYILKKYRTETIREN
jgi:hypothetical protein